MADRKPTSVATYYDTLAVSYHDRYDRAEAARYPANYIRLQILLDCMVRRRVKRAIEVGIGEGTPLATLAEAGLNVCGFDVSERMVARAQERLQKHGIEQDNIIRADIADPLTYASLLRNGPFDAAIAMGVMPHIDNDAWVLNNISSLVKPGGVAFIEFRNKLFSLFTFNRYTVEFIVNDLLSEVSADLRGAVQKELSQRVRMDLPKPSPVQSKFHNPLELPELLGRVGLRNPRFHWYHYHPALPMLEEACGEIFRADALRLEHETSGWRGMFLCSAFVIEADKGSLDDRAD